MFTIVKTDRYNQRDQFNENLSKELILKNRKYWENKTF